MERVEHGVQRDAFAAVTAFRTELYSCLLSRGDALFELCDALLCTDGLVRTIVDLALAAPSTRRQPPASFAEPSTTPWSPPTQTTVVPSAPTSPARIATSRTSDAELQSSRRS